MLYGDEDEGETERDALPGVSTGRAEDGMFTPPVSRTVKAVIDTASCSRRYSGARPMDLGNSRGMLGEANCAIMVVGIGVWKGIN